MKPLPIFFTRLILFFLCNSAFINIWANEKLNTDNKLTIIRTIAPQSDIDTAHHYFTDLIQLALDKSYKKFGPAQLVLSRSVMTQGRWFKMLENSNYLDIAWGGANFKRDKYFKPIEIDLLGGILGVRSIIIRKADRTKFLKIHSLEQLKKLTACQASHWPDTKILMAAGLKVLKVNKFEAIYPMLSRKRCDYFPRGIHEGYGEIERYHALLGTDLIMFDDFLLVYPFNMWLYVDVKNKALYQRINYGLTAAVSDGSFKQFMKKHSVTAHLFPLKKWANKTVFVLKNNQQQKPHSDNAWWLLKQFPFYKKLNFRL